MEITLDHLLLCAQFGEHPDPARGAGQWIEVRQRLLELMPEIDDFASHPTHGVDEAVVVTHRDRLGAHLRGDQHVGTDPM
jgi:hypothetical protein